MKSVFDKEIFKEMILYISERCKDNPNFGSVHLNKILHYSDFFWYAENNESISNETYIREKHGQIPKHLVAVRQELEQEGKLKLEEREHYNRTQKRPIVTTPIQYERLTNEQMELIDKIIDAISGFSAYVVSEQIAHEDLSWQCLENGEEIPYETVFFRRKNRISDDSMKWARDIVNEYEESLGKPQGAF